MEKIKVTIKRDGSIEYTVHGVKGKLCKAVSAFIDKMGRVLSTNNTSEYNQSEDPTQKERYKM